MGVEIDEHGGNEACHEEEEEKGRPRSAGPPVETPRAPEWRRGAHRYRLRETCRGQAFDHNGTIVTLNLKPVHEEERPDEPNRTGFVGAFSI